MQINEEECFQKETSFEDYKSCLFTENEQMRKVNLP